MKSFKKLIILNLIICLFAGNVQSQNTNIRGFADSQGGTLSQSGQPSGHGFSLGQFDLFITSQINDRTTFLAETVFEWDNVAKQFSIDVERIQIRYSFNNLINFSTGKFHTPFGYWNNAYHHGALIQPTISRPAIIKFEDGGGILPIHQVGFQLDGEGIGKWNLGYNLFVSNGQAQGNSGGSYGYQSSMAGTGAIHMEPLEDLKIIFSGYYNNVPAGASTYQGIILPQSSNYQLMNAAITYFNGVLPFEFAAEYYSIRNSINHSGTQPARGMYGYLGYKKSLIKPYIMYNRIDYDSNEKYFIANSMQGITGGLRYHLSPQSVIKVEYSHENTDVVKSQTIFRAQLAIGF